MAWSSNSKSNYLMDSENLNGAKKHIEVAKFCMENGYSPLAPGTCFEYDEDTKTNYVKSKVQLRSFLEKSMSEGNYF